MDTRMNTTRSHPRREIELGHEPPLLSHEDLPDRRTAAIRWTAGTALLGVAACTLFGCLLLGAFDNRVRFATAPMLVVSRYARQAVAEGNRGDPDIRRMTVDAPAVRIEQLNNSGSILRFTRVLARLAEIDPEPHPDQDHKQVADSANGASEPVAAPELPPVILFGASHRSQSRALPHAVSAYADDSSLPRIQPPLGEPLNVTAVARSAPSHDTRQHVVINSLEGHWLF